MNPEAIKDHWHARIASRFAELITGGALRAIHWNPRERPFFGTRSRTINAIPAVDVESMFSFLRRRRPCFGTLGIITAGRIKPIDIRKTGRAMENIIA